MTGFGDGGVLPRVGTPPFFPALLSSIRAAAPNLPLDPVVLQALLLCLLAGDKNLILRTREEDVRSVTKLAASTLFSVFGYSTHKLKIRPDSKHQTPPEFLRSLFLHTSNYSSSSPNASDNLIIGNTPSSRTPKVTYSKFPSGTRTSPTASQKTHRHLFQRSFSFPTECPASDATVSSSNFRSSDHHPNVESSSGTDLQRPLLRPPGIHTDPSPSLTRHFSLDTMTLPKALVISGLENAGTPAQRALLQVLSDKTAVLENGEGSRACNLPEGFIVVYVCVADPRERPAIHKSLLDRFAMSTTITLHPSTQQAIRHTHLHHHHSFSPIFPETLLKSLRSLAEPPPLFATHSKTNIHPNLSLYISDLFSAARHHPQLDGMLLTARAHKDVQSLVRAGRVIGGDLTGAEFIRMMAKEAEANLESGSDVREGTFEEGGDAESSDMGLDEENNVDSSPHHSSPNLDAATNFELDETLDVSEADIARIVPRVLSHRVRVRSRPEDEILGSLVYTAVPSCAECDWENEPEDGDNPNKTGKRTTVKDILVKILAEV